MLSPSEEAEWFSAESFESETFDAEGDIIGKTKDYSVEEGYEGDNTTYVSVKPNTKHQFIFHNSQDSEAAKAVDIAIKTNNDGDIRKMRDNESLFDAESFDAEEYLSLGKDNWDLYELDDGSKNIKIADKITKKFNQEMHKTIKKVKEGSDPDEEAEELFDKMERFMEKYEDEGATDSEPMDVLDETINQVFEKHGYSIEYYGAETFHAEIPKSVKMGFGFATGLALFQVAVIAGAVGIGMLMKKDE